MKQTREATSVEHTINNYTTIHPKPHTHVMLTQMNFNQALQKFRERGNDNSDNYTTNRFLGK